MKNCFILLLATAMLFACSKDDSDDDTGSSGGSAQMSASIDAVAWESSDDNPVSNVGASFLKNTARYYLIDGYAEDGSSILLYVYGIAVDIQANETYNVGPSFAAKYSPESISSGNVYSTDLQSQGSLTFDILEDDRVSGTFSFTATNGVDEVSVTNGTFDIKQ